ncbi:MAG: hypothetical protein A2806_04110 [Candidatus Terrybacteria bacterium RIFCSPHIGHO2_01_FULL_48_17]|uniref:O-antigen ligase-related domain-containing protein n=1 Tax=Candidatus Terrybacteria bacterium RIFCSPHIGHO2_01_FULL_48_17 TaxID=1802362 RepID=A0A1G2PMM2_9BACT|nr:MAG: hypothetical protein A2806_04110 [Candidatus Terrybacteria bacterium RIFCSPHIGHO2_01_FULL_48_17]OHA53741.1 MAG: hypothetical protein A3A30_05225 [Candidatus Terrybacteria bacterium RIFCSPLOWO2_01_FULL_48_14]
MSIPRVFLYSIFHLLSSRKEEFLLAFFVLTAPLQIRWFLKDLTQLVDVEWTQAWVWLSDFVLLALVAVWIWRGGHKATRAMWPILFSVPVFVLAALSPNPILGLWSAVKLAEGLALFSYVRANKNIAFSRASIISFVAIVTIMAVVAIAQFWLQHDLGLQKIGESELSPNLPAVAKFELPDGSKLMRAYSLAPHPNIAAVIFLAGIFVISWLYIKRGVGLVWRFSFKRLKQELVLGVSLFVLLFALAVTFSRSAWMGFVLGIGVLVAGIVIIPTLLRVYIFEALRFMLLVIAIVGLLYFAVPGMQIRTHINSQEQAVTLRKFFSEQAIEMLKEKPILGVGPGQFVEELAARHIVNLPGERLTLGPIFLQPVHNVPFLWAAEYGLPIAMLFLLFGMWLFLRKLFNIIRESGPASSLQRLLAVSLFASFVSLFMFDHFFWTLQQGRLLFFLTLAFL